mmetsp:Transcript_29857/g.60821  ORF Transcript_29857/g.60821 Transcript_29857/m.60821 type:complete len:496 (+) Transcript_29857:149-1636(+)
MAGSKRRRCNVHAPISVQCVLAAVVAMISLLGPGVIICVLPRSVLVSASKQPFAFCHIAPKSIAGMITIKFRFHPSRIRSAGRGYCRRDGKRLHALDTALPHPRGIPAFQGESNDDVKSVPIILNDGVDIVSSHAIRPLMDGHLQHSNGLDEASPSQHGLLSHSDEGDLNGPNERVLLAGAVVSFILAVISVLKLSPSGCWRYYLAGGICASTSHALTTPIDVVKTRQQVDPWLEEKSMFEATLAIIKQGGPLALLAGLGPTALGYLIEGSVKFGTYEVTKPATLRFVASMASFLSLPALDSKILSLVICGIISGTAASVMLSPMEALRIRIVSDAEFSEMSSLKAAITMLKREGIRSLTKGLPAMMFKQVPYTITKNVSFDLFTTSLYSLWREMGYAITANVKFAIPLVSAMSAAVLSCVSSHPGDMLLSLVNAHEGSKRTRDFAKDIWKGRSGVGGFFVGIRPRFLHVLVIVTVQLLIYDFIKRLVGIAATGM